MLCYTIFSQYYSMKVMQIMLSVQDNKELFKKYCIFCQKINFFGTLKKFNGASKNRLKTQNSVLLGQNSKLKLQVSTLPLPNGVT